MNRELCFEVRGARTKHAIFVGEAGMTIGVEFLGEPIRRAGLIMNRERLMEFQAWLNKRIDETWSRARVESVDDKSQQGNDLSLPPKASST